MALTTEIVDNADYVGHVWVKAVTKAISRLFLFLTRGQPTPTKPSIADRKRQVLPTQEPGLTQYPTIKALLDDLDSVFPRMKRLQPKNSEAQKMLKKFGTYVMHLCCKDDDAYLSDHLDFRGYGLPSFLSCYENLKAYIHIGDEDVAEVFFVAIKMRALTLWIKRDKCVYYNVVAVISDKHCARQAELYYVVEVNTENGAVNALRSPQQRYHNLKGGGSYASLNWEYPKIYEGQEQLTHSTSNKRLLEHAFCKRFNAVMRRECAVNIIVKKGELRATFTVPENRWKYFFKDRIDVMTPSGRKRPIFHAVIAHIRHTKKKDTPVRTHYRGSRDFHWNGYSIKIVMQGKHGASQASFTAEGHEDLENLKDGACVLTGKWGDRINQVFEGERMGQKI